MHVTMAAGHSCNPEEEPLLQRQRNYNVDGENASNITLMDMNKPLPSSKLLLALSFTWIGSFLASLDSTITSTLSATIASEFNSLSLISWLGSAYLIALAATQPLSGKLSDIFGRRPSLIFCSIIFAAGNAMCAAARTYEMIIFGRVLSGIGGGGLNSIATFLATDLIDQRRRGLWQGYGMIVYGAGLGLGGVMGGSINDTYGWRWVFLLLTPLTLVCICGMYHFVPGSKLKETEHIDSIMTQVQRIDFLGASLLVSALAFLLWAFNYEDQNGRLSPLVLKIALPAAMAILGAFVVVEIYVAKEPVIPLHLLGSRTVLAASLSSLFVSMSLYTTMFYVPLYFQIRGNTPTQAGLLLIPESVGVALGSLSTGFMMRLTGYCGKLKLVMLIIFFAGPTGFALNKINTSIGFSEFYLLLNGLGFGGILTTMTIALICAIDHKFQAAATGLLYLFRSSGATIGITLSGAIFRKVLSSQISVGDGKLGDCMGPSRTHCSESLLNAYLVALNATFLLAAGYATFGLVSGTLARHYKLDSTVPGQQQEEQ